MHRNKGGKDYSEMPKVENTSTDSRRPSISSTSKLKKLFSFLKKTENTPYETLSTPAPAEIATASTSISKAPARSVSSAQLQNAKQRAKAMREKRFEEMPVEELNNLLSSTSISAKPPATEPAKHYQKLPSKHSQKNLLRDTTDAPTKSSKTAYQEIPTRKPKS